MNSCRRNFIWTTHFELLWTGVCWKRTQKIWFLGASKLPFLSKATMAYPAHSRKVCLFRKGLATLETQEISKKFPGDSGTWTRGHFRVFPKFRQVWNAKSHGTRGKWSAALKCWEVQCFFFPLSSCTRYWQSWLPGSQVFAKNYTECYPKQHCNHRTAKSVQLFMNPKLWRFLAKRDWRNWWVKCCADCQHAERSCDIWSVGVMLYWLMMLGGAFDCHCLFSVVWLLIISEPIFSWNHFQQPFSKTPN